jgi:hypothetical protein
VILVLAVLVGLALVLVLAYFRTHRRSDAWESFRRRRRERGPRSMPEQPIDPTFQFDEPPPDGPKQE